MGAEVRRLRSLLKQHERVAIDTPVFIYHFEDHPRYGELASGLLESVESGRNHATVSVLARLEVLVRPLREGREDLADSYRFILDTFPNLHLVDINAGIADTAAALRAVRGLSTSDSLHLACALDAGCTLFITNDGGISSIDSLEVVTLDSLLM